MSIQYVLLHNHKPQRLHIKWMDDGQPAEMEWASPTANNDMLLQLFKQVSRHLDPDDQMLIDGLIYDREAYANSYDPLELDPDDEGPDPLQWVWAVWDKVGGGREESNNIFEPGEPTAMEAVRDLLRQHLIGEIDIYKIDYAQKARFAKLPLKPQPSPQAASNHRTEIFHKGIFDHIEIVWEDPEVPIDTAISGLKKIVGVCKDEDINDIDRIIHVRDVDSEISLLPELEEYDGEDERQWLNASWILGNGNIQSESTEFPFDGREALQKIYRLLRDAERGKINIRYIEYIGRCIFRGSTEDALIKKPVGWIRGKSRLYHDVKIQKGLVEKSDDGELTDDESENASV